MILLAWSTVNFAVRTQPTAPDIASAAGKVADGYCTCRKWSGDLAEES